MLLYHGSKSGIQGDIKPDYFRNRNTCDFGKGFYLGDLPDQPKGLIVGRPQGRFYEIEYDNSNLKVKDFSAVDDYTTKIDCLRHVKLGKQYVLKSEEACKKERMQILVDRVLSEKEIKLLEELENLISPEEAVSKAKSVPEFKINNKYFFI